jgi:hypothetical protein
MKKIIFTSLIALISLSTFAQGKSQKNKNKSENSVFKNDKERDDDDRYDDKDNRGRKQNKMKDGDRNDNRNDDRDDNNNKYSKNTPRKVGDAFRRDFPNARNVTWTKNSGTWTANFGSGILGNIRSATYRANGQRVSTNGILGRRNN